MQEYINILRMRAEDAEHGLAQPTNPAFLTAVVRPLVPSDMADGLAAPALVDPSDLLHQGCTMVNGARHWPRHGEGLVPVRPHIPLQRVQDVLV